MSDDITTRPFIKRHDKPVSPHDEVYTKIVDKPLCKLTAGQILTSGAEAIDSRASERDTDKERSMAKAVGAFNVMYEKDLTVVEGWQFMVMLKQARAAQGDFRMDDYEDEASYAALAGEAAQG